MQLDLHNHDFFFVISKVVCLQGFVLKLPFFLRKQMYKIVTFWLKLCNILLQEFCGTTKFFLLQHYSVCKIVPFWQKCATTYCKTATLFLDAFILKSLTGSSSNSSAEMCYTELISTECLWKDGLWTDPTIFCIFINFPDKWTAFRYHLDLKDVLFFQCSLCSIELSAGKWTVICFVKDKINRLVSERIFKIIFVCSYRSGFFKK